MTTQKKQTTSSPKMSLWQRINAVRAEIGSVAHDKQIGEGSYAYTVTTHQAILKKLRPLMAQHGLVDYVALGSMELVDTGMRQGKQQRVVNQHRGWYDYVIRNVDDPEDLHTFPVLAYADDAGDKGPGKVNTYALKAGQKILFQIGTSDDEEEAREANYTRAEDVPITPEQLDELLSTADTYFGDEANDKIESLCKKVLNIDSITKLPAAHFDATMSMLRKQALRDGRIEEE